jgi:hypothetical protein
LPKTLAEIAIEAGLVDKPNAARAGRLAEQRKQPLVVVLVRELGIDEVALVGALRKQTRVPLIDVAEIQIDPDALRLLSRDTCARLRVLPLALTTEGGSRVLRVAMADPTDTAAVAEIESITRCEIDIATLPLSAIDELVDKGYRQINTAVVTRSGGTMFVTTRGKVQTAIEGEQEVSVTAQIPIAALQAAAADDVELRLSAMIQVLMNKGLVTEAELAEAIRKLSTGPRS